MSDARRPAHPGRTPTSAPPSVVPEGAESLRESVLRFRATFDLAPVGLAHLAPHGRFLHVNAALCRLLDVAPGDLVGRSLRELAHPDDAAEAVERFLHLVAGEVAAIALPLRLVVGGATRAVRLSASLVRDADAAGAPGLPFFCVAAFEGADPERTSEGAAARERTRAFLERVTAATPDLIYVFDLTEGRNSYANGRLVDILGHEPAHVAALGDRLFPTLVHPDDLPRVAARLAGWPTVPDGVLVETEYRMRHADGSWRWLHGRELVFTRDAGGRPREILGVAQDVTARRVARDRTERLQRVTASLAALLTPREATELVVREGCDAIGTPFGTVGLLVDDPERGTVFELASTQGQAVEDYGAWRRFPVDLPIPFADAVRTRRAVTVATTGEYLARYPALAENIARCGVTGVVVVPLETEGRVHGALSFDLTDGRVPTDDDVAFLGTLAQQCAQALERARLFEAERAARARSEGLQAEAERANRAKSDFLAVMSHELRTPLNGIAGHVQLLEMGIHGPIAPAQQEALARVARAQRHLLGVIDDVLDFARLEAGRVEYHVAPVALAEVLADVVPMVEPVLAERGLTFALHLPDHPEARPPRVLADRARLAQVLLNLLSNAGKFTPAGGHVAIEVARPDAARRDAVGDVVFVRVHDTGVGIPADQHETVFAPFVQLDGGARRAHGGTGLGLAISRDMARGMGGELRVRSTVGAGTTFTLTLREAKN